MVTVRHEDAFDTFLGGVAITIIPIGIGIYGIRRGRKAQAVEVQPGSEPAAKPFQETIRSDSLVKDTESKIVIKMPWWFRVTFWPILLFGILLLFVGLADIPTGDAGAFWIGGFGLLFTLLGIWTVGMTTKVNFNKPPGYMTVIRGHRPLFLWFLRIKRISKEEARSVFVHTHHSIWDPYIHHEVRVVARSGKEVELYHTGKWGDIADYLAKRILDFAQEEVELRPGARFSMRVDEAFQTTFATGALGMVVGGRVEQGTITNGDDVEIRGRERRKKAKIFEVDTLEGSGAEGERVRLLVEDVTEDDVRWGDLVEKV